MNTTDNKYNGWTNYATWRVNLELFDGIDVNETFNSDDDLAGQLEAYAEDIIFIDSSQGLARDYALAFVSDVNWYEIAEHLIEDANND
jgi:hypothetical protein